MNLARNMWSHWTIFRSSAPAPCLLAFSNAFIIVHRSLASQPYFPPCAHARMISGWGEGRENTSGDYRQDFVSLWNVIISKINETRLLAYLHLIHSGYVLCTIYRVSDQFPDRSVFRQLYLRNG